MTTDGVIYPVIKHNENLSYILCPVCGCSFKPNDQNLCLNCLSSDIDITSDIIKKNKNLSIKQCDSCKRWYDKSKMKWKITEIGSPDLKQMLLHKIKGLYNKKEHKLINSSFIDANKTNSNQIGINIHLSKAVTFDDDNEPLFIDANFCLFFKIEIASCPECEVSTDLHSSWKCCVQIIQNDIFHRRLLLFLEQLLLKNHHYSFVNCTEIVFTRQGMDFYFDKKALSKQFMSHLRELIACNINEQKAKASNSKNCAINNAQKYKSTFIAELPQIDFNDLCLIPLKLQKKCGGYSPLMLCHKISSSLHFIDPCSGHQFSLDSKQYFLHRFKSIASVNALSVFYVINVEEISSSSSSKYGCKLFEIELQKFDDLGQNEDILECVTTFDWVQCGDMVRGYDVNKLSNTVNLFGKMMKKYRKKHKIPDVILVQKYWEEMEFEANKERKWKLKRMEDRVRMADNYKMDKHAKEKNARDFEMFLNQLQLHPVMRAQINLYKNEKYQERDECKDNDEEDIVRIADEELIKEEEKDQIDVEMDNEGN